jgi:hypothetical protein
MYLFGIIGIIKSRILNVLRLKKTWEYQILEELYDLEMCWH